VIGTSGNRGIGESGNRKSSPRRRGDAEKAFETRKKGGPGVQNPIVSEMAIFRQFARLGSSQDLTYTRNPSALNTERICPVYSPLSIVREFARSLFANER
jgi:hypothetical protein